MREDFVKACFAGTPTDTITAYFTDGGSADYTTAVLGLLMSDRSVECIIDGQTGEVIYSR